jgi:quercetin dioxygenase-like cupin family protein
LSFVAGGEIGTHVAGLDQLFYVLSGSPWIDVNGRRDELDAGSGVFVKSGDSHAKGSASGASVLMVQLTDLTPG